MCSDNHVINFSLIILIAASSLPACHDDLDSTTGNAINAADDETPPQALNAGPSPKSPADPIPSTTVQPAAGCGKVDFLFVIDNSVSMQDEQDALIASFPGFIETIQNTLNAGDDYHIMVVDTDSTGKCTAANCENGTGMCSAQMCAQMETFTNCDTAWGAGVVHPAGVESSDKDCNLPDGRRYLQGGDPNLTDTFACMAKVGLSGNASERPMDAMVAALSTQQASAGACNDGFLRDDAILVVTFLSDDPWTEDMNTPKDWDPNMDPSDTVDDWYEAVLDAKGGNTSAVVMLGLIPTGEKSNGTMCGKNEQSGVHWQQLVERFGAQGLHAPICQESFVPFFEQAVNIIDTTCDQFDILID